MPDEFTAAPPDGEIDIDSLAAVDQDADMLLITQSVAVEVEPAPIEEPPSLISRLFGRHSRQRLQALSGAIDLYPDSSMNYVLRGELYLSFDEPALAEADFRQALSLAQADYETSRWGLVAQAVQDRARVGLAKAAGRP